MKFNKTFLTILSTTVVVAPISAIVACNEKTDELNFDEEITSPREYTFELNKELSKDFIKPYENLLNSMKSLAPTSLLGDYSFLESLENSLNKAEDLKRESEILNAKFEAFNKKISGSNYNDLNNTYLKAIDFVDQKDANGKVTVEGGFNMNYKALKLNLKSYYKDVTVTILKNLVSYSDIQVQDPKLVTSNHFYIDEDFVKKNIDVSTNAWSGSWSDAIVRKRDDLAKVLTDNFEIAKELNSFANKALVVATKDINDATKTVSVPGDVSVEVERGQAPTLEDVNLALNKLSDSNGKAVTWNNAANAVTNQSVTWFKNDEFWLAKSAFTGIIGALKNAGQTSYIDEYKTYLEGETKTTIADYNDLYIRNANDYYKFVGIVGKNIDSGRDVLHNISVAVKLFININQPIYSKAVKNLGQGDVIVLKDLNDISTTNVVSGGTLIIVSAATPWGGVTTPITDKVSFKDALSEIATKYGARGFKAALESVFIPGVDSNKQLTWQTLGAFVNSGDTSWKKDLGDYTRIQLS